MSTDISEGNFTDRLGEQIESLQGIFRKLSKAATPKDMAAQFCLYAGNVFTGATIGLFLRPAPTADWQLLSGAGDSSLLPELDARHGATVFSFVEGRRRIFVVHTLVDGSTLGVEVSGSGAPYSDIDVMSLRLFVTLLDNAYQELIARRNEKELIFSLNHRVLQLNSLIDTGIQVSKLTGETIPHHLALERAAALTNASKGLVTVTGAGRILETLAFPHDASAGGEKGGRHRISAEFTFAETRYVFELFDKESRNGIIPFDETDHLLLDALARQVHASMENRFLHAQALEKQKIEQEIAVAASIQQRILPRALPQIDGYDIAGINIPSKSVGGDYYDCIPLNDGRYAMVIADVAGKGVPAALLVSSFHAYLTANLEYPIPLVDLAVKLNRAIVRTSTEDKFITAFFAVLHPSSGALETVNAGHNPVFLRHVDGKVQELSEGGVPLGMLDLDFPYKSETLVIGRGDRLLLYTDGIPEATNEREQLYDEGFPLRGFVAGHLPERAGTFIRDLIGDVRKFTGAAPQNDDITALYLVRQ